MISVVARNKGGCINYTREKCDRRDVFKRAARTKGRATKTHPAIIA